MKGLLKILRARLTPAPTKQEIAWADLEADMKRNLEEHDVSQRRAERIRDRKGRFARRIDDRSR